MVGYTILLNKLDHYGIKKTIMTGSHFTYTIENSLFPMVKKNSSLETIRCGVPHRSILDIFFPDSCD